MMYIRRTADVRRLSGRLTRQEAAGYFVDDARGFAARVAAREAAPGPDFQFADFFGTER